MKIAVIPARGGSKRIPRKNIRIRRLPMIAHSCAPPMRPGCSSILVSSEDDKSSPSAACGGEPLRRPPELADDHAATIR